MKAINAKVTKGVQVGSLVSTCDNSGAKLIKIISVKGHKTVKARNPSAGVGDLLVASVKKGKPEMRNQRVYATMVRQRKEFRRPDGMRVVFEDNAAVVLKDLKGNPKGTIFKGAVSKEVCNRFPGVAKVANIIV